MTNINKIIIVGIAIIALALGAYYFVPNSEVSLSNKTPVIMPTAELSFLSLEAQSNEEGSVTITVLPRIAEGADRWEFAITLDTHSVELSQDIAAISVLRDDTAGTYAPLVWEGNPPGGHHREGTLVFAPITPVPQTITLDIRYKIIVRYFPYVLLTAIVVIGLGWFISARPHLPPTTMQKHIESSPSAHIISKPIPDSIQRHMLEHADGKGKPGVIMQYNCQKFTCESDFIQKLASLAAQYPDNVYLAPNSYDGKLILTKNGSLKILENFDEQAIKDFIE